MIYALLHFLNRVSGAPTSIHLCPAGNPGLDVMPPGKRRDHVMEKRVVSSRMGAGADGRHVATQNIYELRQFVNIGAAYDTANAGHARVVFDGLSELAPVLHCVHRPELQNTD